LLQNYHNLDVKERPNVNLNRACLVGDKFYLTNFGTACRIRSLIPLKSTVLVLFFEEQNILTICYTRKIQNLPF